MKSLNVYLSFAGNCEEGMNFIKDALQAESVEFFRYGEMGDPSTAPGMTDKIYHSTLKAESIVIMGADMAPEHHATITAGSNVSLSLDLKDEGEMEAIFARLSKGGHVRMPLQEVPWGARFGMLTDKFGFHWLLNLDRPKA